MSHYIAKKVTLDTKTECSNRSCGCFTEKGYFIKYENRNVEGVLFVCEECFDKNYKDSCSIQESQTYESPRVHVPSYQPDHPQLRKGIRALNKTIRFFRRAHVPVMIALSIVILALSGTYHLRTDVNVPQTKKVEITGNICERLDDVMTRVEYVVRNIRRENDGKDNHGKRILSTVCIDIYFFNDYAWAICRGSNCECLYKKEQI